MTRSRVNADNSRSNTRSFASTTEPSTFVDGSIWVDTDGVAAAVQRLRWKKTPNAGTTVFTGNNDEGNFSLIYTPNYEEVFLNGVLLVRGTDYSATSGDSITLVEATVAGDILEVFCTPNLAVTDVYTTSQSEARYLSKSLVDAKGDLYVATSDNTTVRLPVGSNDRVLVADSTATAGVAWKPYGAQQVAGKNFIINGNFDVWSRGTSFVYTSSPLWNADRWYDWAASNNSRQAFTASEVPGAKYFLRSAGGLAGGYHSLQQSIEDGHILLSGQTVTLSFWAKVNSGSSFILEAFTGLSNDQQIVGTTFTVTASWQKFTATFNIPTYNNSLATYRYLRFYIESGNAITLDLAQVQLELGAVATTFSRAGGTLDGEIQACQRFYWRSSNTSGAACIGQGVMYTANAALITVRHPVPMRVAPTAVESGSVQVSDTVNALGLGSGITINQNSSETTTVYIQSLSTGTQFRYAELRTTATNGYIAFYAELV